MIKKLFFTLIFLIAIFSTSSFVYSHDATLIPIAKEKVNPGDDYKYVIKRFQEKVKLYLFSVSPRKKLSFFMSLVDIRLSELKYVVEGKDISNFQTASQRYSATSGEATDFLLRGGTKENKGKLIEKFQGHIPVLMKLQEPYIPDNSEWRFLQDNINSLKSYISKLSE